MIHLHCHTEYSLLDSINRVPELVKRAKELGQSALAMTDHGTVSGAVEFWKECREVGIKPILGCEMYLDAGKENRHITVLARNKQGFASLVKLTSASYANFYRKPRVTTMQLLEEADGLIVLSGCTNGVLSHSVLQGKIDRDWYELMIDSFGDRFFLEVMFTGISDQQKVSEALFALSPGRCVPTGDVHYLTPDDAFAHMVALNVKVNKRISDPDAFKYQGEGYYLKSHEEMLERWPERIVNRTHLVAEMVEEYDIGNTSWALPSVEMDEPSELAELDRRLHDYLYEKDDAVDEYTERLQYEFEVITKNGFLPYFKIVADLCAHIDSLGHFRGWGRGSVSGSLVAFLYGITKIDPIKWELYFERFLNPDRITPPDIDLDFMPEDRAEAISFMKKYGDVVQVGTFGTLGTKEVIHSVSKAMGITTQLDRLVPEQAPQPTIKELLGKSEPFRRQAELEDGRFIETLLRLEGLKRNESIHPAGVVLNDGRIPVRQSKSGVNMGVVNTAWDMYALEDLRYVKYDILGVTNLQIIDSVCRQVGIKVEDIPIEDESTMQLVRDCKTIGVFQWESDGYKNVIRRLQPATFEHLRDLNTLYRPGPLESGITDLYIARRHGAPVEQLHPKLTLGNYGLPLYQENIMQLARDLAGFTLPQADELRKAIGKKEKESFIKMKNGFIVGCRKHSSMTADEAEELWSKVEKYARYTWNKAHAVAYTLISWWTAYLSTHHVAVFFAELLNQADSGLRRRILLSESRRRGINIHAPDVNQSERGFAGKGNDLYVGLAGVRFVGPKTVDALIAAREKGGEFKDQADLKLRGKINKRAIESLADAGALEQFGETTDADRQREALGFSIGSRKIDAYWWADRAPQLGEVIDIHKITTKKGQPMAFLSVETCTELISVTVFPGYWETIRDDIGVGFVGLFVSDVRKVLQRVIAPDELDKLWMQVPRGAEQAVLDCFKYKGGAYNVWVDGRGVARIPPTEDSLRFVNEEFGIEQIIVAWDGRWYLEVENDNKEEG